MSGFVDLHCHYVPGIDDGARSDEDGVAMLQGLGQLGFSRVIATPHTRPGMFDNTRETIRAAFDRFGASLSEPEKLPALELSSEHYFDDVVFRRLLAGEALPYPGGRAVLLEFYEIDFPPMIQHRLLDLRVRGLLPVIAHPERYRCLWRAPDTLERMVDTGIGALLDVAALVGKYGRQIQSCAEELLERGLYHAACSDAHRPSDIAEVRAGIERVRELYGDEEVHFLLAEGPQSLLDGVLPE
ncbi:MAG TPA: CpsB/CapC family capsule biosynthesis tyrosine phosphatase [Polyangiaceae bacterium]|jgi:protein-tyrosine phosphatase|nr:CpsB/CapC family capsule biosynthesis tyrosine phosphatase [Polyangiaceae bacterium]